MTPSAAWRLLEIDANSDTKAIRRAYAAKLRAIDPDEDPEAFTALREARDRALAIAARAAEGGSASDEALTPIEAPDGVERLVPCPPLPLAAPLIGSTIDAMADLSVPIPAEPGDDWQMPPHCPDFRADGENDGAIGLALPDWHEPPLLSGPAGRDSADEHRPDRQLHAILFPDPDTDTSDRQMTAAEIVAGRTMIGQIHIEAQQGAIDLYARAESWLADVLAGAWPRSHPLLPRAADLFAWAAREGQIDVPPAIEYINRRLASDRFAETVQDKGHPLNRAWQQLSKPARPGQSRALWWQGSQIDELLMTIRRDHPEVEGRLDWHRVALWDAHRAKPIRWWTIAIGVIFALQIFFRILTAVSPAPPANPAEDSLPPLAENVAQSPVVITPRVPGGLGDSDADLNAAILAALGPGVTIETLRTRAPLVLQLFESNWRISLDSGRTRTQYVEAMERVIRDRYVQLARQVGGDDLIALQRRRLKEERALKGERWKDCAETGERGGLADPTLIPPDLRAKNRDEIGELVLAMPDNPERQTWGGTFHIPGKIVEQTIETSGLTQDQVTAAFVGKGSDRERCLTHIALLQAALAADAKTRSELITHI